MIPSSCVTCTAGGEDDVGLPCDGVKLSLFSTPDDMCGWCPKTCVPYLKEGGQCWKDVTGSGLYVSNDLLVLASSLNSTAGDLRTGSDLPGDRPSGELCQDDGDLLS